MKEKESKEERIEENRKMCSNWYDEGWNDAFQKKNAEVKQAVKNSHFLRKYTILHGSLEIKEGQLKKEFLKELGLGDEE